ncbi:MAG: hypothetical protein U0892_18265 [Pirellulales bacterium]
MQVQQKIDRAPVTFRRCILLFSALFALCLLGCDKQSSDRPKSADSGSPPAKGPSVPLRVAWIGTEEDAKLLRRQWAAQSELELDFKGFTESQLSAESNVPCDLIVVPARSLGECIERKWIEPLPLSVDKAVHGSTRGSDANEGTSDENHVTTTAMREQIQFGKQRWGVSLGCSLPVLLSNGSFPAPPVGAGAEENWAWWQAALEQAEKGHRPQGTSTSPVQSVTETQLTARFLAIAAGLTDRDARYGLLLHSESLQPKLTELHFIRAATILRRLHKLNPSAGAVDGSWRHSWQAVAEGKIALAVGVPQPELDATQPVTTVQSSLLPEVALTASSRSTWNSGESLIVCLSSSCRQSGKAEEFMKWLSQTDTRASLAQGNTHVDAGRRTFAPGSSADQALRNQEKAAGKPFVPCEPRAIGAPEYRAALEQQLKRIVTEDADVEAALKSAAEEWNAITTKLGKSAVKRSYQLSLGL